MPDLRYHLISLISVFLALAVGVLLGVTMADEGVITDQLRSQVSDIEKEVESQREVIAEREAEISELQERVNATERVMEGMSQAMVEDQLAGVEVALVSGPWASDEVFQEVQSTLTEAGASFTTARVLEPPDPEESSGGYEDEAREVLNSGETPDDPEIVVFVGGGARPSDAPEGAVESLLAAERAMFEVWTGAGVRVVAAESSATDRTEIPLFQDAGVPSMDNADQPAGRAGIVELALGDADGSYGVKPRASAPFPPES